MIRAGVSAVAVLTVAAALALVAPPLRARQDQRPPTFRGEANFVYVDAYPRRNGRLVDDLRAEEFQIFEDGKPQKVQTFEFIRIAPNAPDNERRDPNTKEDGDRQAADPRNRVFVIYLDSYHTTFVGAHDTRGPLLEFLGRTIGPNDLFGVLTPEVPVNRLVFGRSLETLQSELTVHYDWGLGDPERPVSPRGKIEQQLWMCGPDTDPLIRLYREDQLSMSLQDLMFHLRDLRDERKNVLLVSEGWIPRGPQPMAGSRGVPLIGPGPGGRLGIGVPKQGEMGNESWCNAQMMRLSNIDFEQRFRDLLNQARRANVSFYPIDVGGLKVNLPTASMRGTPSPQQTIAMLDAGRNRVDTLRILAENTDGHAIVNTNDLAGGFKKIADDLSGYYLLGYSSSNTGLDGKFHRIEVKVTRSGISVSARPGYLAAMPDTRPASSTPAPPEPLTAERGRLARLRPDAELFSYGVPSGDGLDVVAEIASGQLGQPQWAKGAAVDVQVEAASGGPATATGRIEAGERSALVHVPLGASSAGPWRVVVRVAGNEALDDRFEVAPPAGALLGPPMVFRGTASARVPLRPVADFLFRRTERLHVEWPVTVPLDQRAARLLDQRGQPMAIAVTVTERQVEARSAVAADLLLAPLGEADYLIELTAGAGAATERHYLAFRVVR